MATTSIRKMVRVPESDRGDIPADAAASASWAGGEWGEGLEADVHWVLEPTYFSVVVGGPLSFRYCFSTGDWGFGLQTDVTCRRGFHFHGFQFRDFRDIVEAINAAYRVGYSRGKTDQPI